MKHAYISLGSNVGERRGFIRRAVMELAATNGIDVTGVSSLYETTPVGGPPQRSFINAVARIDTSLDPRELLVICQGIEKRIGREASDIRWGPRVIDLDIVLYGDEKVAEEDLEIPHPRMTERLFVLIPLLEMAPELTDPWGTPLSTYVEDADGEVRLLEPF